MNRLNGWLRLWVVLTGAWLIAVGSVAWSERPGRTYILASHEVELVSDPEWVFEATSADGQTLEIRSLNNLPPSKLELDEIFEQLRRGYISNDPNFGRESASVETSSPAPRRAPVAAQPYDIFSDPFAGEPIRGEAASRPAPQSRASGGAPRAGGGAPRVLSTDPNAGEPLRGPVPPQRHVWSTTGAKNPVAPNTIRALTSAGVIEFAVGTDRDNIRSLYEEKVADEERRSRIEFALMVLSWATLPPLSILAVGFCVAWVYRGFRPRGGPVG